MAVVCSCLLHPLFFFVTNWFWCICCVVDGPMWWEVGLEVVNHSSNWSSPACVPHKGAKKGYYFCRKNTRSVTVSCWNCVTNRAVMSVYLYLDFKHFMLFLKSFWKFLYFIDWLLAVLGLCCCAQVFSSCSVWASPCCGFSCFRAWALRSLRQQAWLPWDICGIFLNHGSTPVPWQILNIGPPEKSTYCFWQVGLRGKTLC